MLTINKEWYAIRCRFTLDCSESLHIPNNSKFIELLINAELTTDNYEIKIKNGLIYEHDNKMFIKVIQTPHWKELTETKLVEVSTSDSEKKPKQLDLAYRTDEKQNIKHFPDVDQFKKMDFGGLANIDPKTLQTSQVWSLFGKDFNNLLW